MKQNHESGGPPEHDEVEKFSKSPGSSNNESQNEISVTISAPNSIDITLVDASSLLDYEIWGGLSSVILSFLTGFVVAMVQEPDPKIKGVFKAISLVLFLFLAFTALMSIIKRTKMKKSKKIINLQTSKGIVRKSA